MPPFRLPRCSLGINPKKKMRAGSRSDHGAAVVSPSAAYQDQAAASSADPNVARSSQANISNNASERPPDSNGESGGRRKMTPEEAVFYLTRLTRDVPVDASGEQSSANRLPSIEPF